MAEPQLRRRGGADPLRNLPRAILLGVLCVIAVYVSANVAYIHVLGPGAGSDEDPGGRRGRATGWERAAERD